MSYEAFIYGIPYTVISTGRAKIILQPFPEFSTFLQIIIIFWRLTVRQHFLRSFIYFHRYLGFSWASGVVTIDGKPYPNGRNEESSSESISAYEVTSSTHQSVPCSSPHLIYIVHNLLKYVCANINLGSSESSYTLRKSTLLPDTKAFHVQSHRAREWKGNSYLCFSCNCCYRWHYECTPNS